MRHLSAIAGLDPKDEQLIFALLQEKTNEDAARAAGVSRATLYRRFLDPNFMAAFRAARRQVFDEALCIMEKGARVAAQRLMDEIDENTVSNVRRSRVAINAAKAILDRAFKAQTAIAVEEELAALRTLMEELKAGADRDRAVPAPVLNPASSLASVDAIRKAEDEQAEADRLRVAWMTKVGMDGDAIESSLRLNRPQTVESERYFLELVAKMQEFEEAHQPENLLKFFAGESEGEAENVSA